MTSIPAPRLVSGGRAVWRQETTYSLVWARQRKLATDGSGRALSYRGRLADGSAVVLDAGVVCERLSNEHGERILLSAARAAHVLGRHKLRDEEGGFARGMSLTRLLGLFCRSHREPLGYGEDSDKISVSCDRVVGTAGIVSAEELAGCGVLSAADLDRLAQLKEEAFSASIRSAAEDRAEFIARVNDEWRERNVRFRERNGIVLPAFIAEPQPTRSFVIVLDKRGRFGQPGGDERYIRTVYPGLLLCDSPAHARYMPLQSASDLRPGTTISQLQLRHDRGEALDEHEEEVLRSFRHAFEVWYEHGPVVPAWRARGGGFSQGSNQVPRRMATG